MMLNDFEILRLLKVLHFLVLFSENCLFYGSSCSLHFTAVRKHLRCHYIINYNRQKLVQSNIKFSVGISCTTLYNYSRQKCHEILKGGGPCRVAPQETLIFHNIGSGQMNPKIRCPRLIFRKCLGPVDHDDPTPK
jgi:hypothetical protein